MLGVVGWVGISNIYQSEVDSVQLPNRTNYLSLSEIF